MSFLQFFPCYKENDKLDNDLLCHPFQPCPLCDANTRHKSEIDRNMKNNSKENIWLLNANNAQIYTILEEFTKDIMSKYLKDRKVFKQAWILKFSLFLFISPYKIRDNLMFHN